MQEDIFKICDAKEWNDAVDAGNYRGSALDLKDGFIHFSTHAQVRQTAALHMKGIEGLVLVRVPVAPLGDDLKWEEARNGQLFPHLYTALPAGLATSVVALPLGPDGLHVFPDDLQ